MQQYKVGIIGATGMVGQRFALLLGSHPWFQVTCVAASGRSAGKTYAQAVEGRWAFPGTPIPEAIGALRQSGNPRYFQQQRQPPHPRRAHADSRNQR